LQFKPQQQYHQQQLFHYPSATTYRHLQPFSSSESAFYLTKFCIGFVFGPWPSVANLLQQQQQQQQHTPALSEAA
jgi:hypothetical protein